MRDQLNFYLGESNLVRDKFLRQKLLESHLLPLTLFLNFNRVKDSLAGESSELAKLEIMQAAVNKSNMLKLSKCGKLLKRRLPFEIKRVDCAKMETCTVYVENFPESLTLEHIAKIFARAGDIRNVTLPKFKSTRG